MEPRVTKEQFKDYVRIRDSGMTNMYDVNMVCKLSNEGLTKEICMTIMKHFEDFAKKFGVRV